CLITLNDGGGIGFDNTDGAIIKDNIITDIIGNLESSAPDFPNCKHISFGIYFGNTGVTNTLVQHNTVTRCVGSGIHVDHTMASTGNAIKDNILFNNGIQLSISDWSNAAGPAAVAPYYVPFYNEVYSGNIMYSLTSDQLCMRQYNCYSAQPVDFGTFSNNRYFNPYNELDIYLINTFTGSSKYYSLEKWKQNIHADVGSTRSPLRLNANEVTATIGNELVDNGTFTNNVDGWGGWPTNAQVTHDMTHLDNGALKANLPDGSVYPLFSMRNPLAFPMESGKWYRMSFSLQSDIQGQLTAGVKGLTQMTGLNTIGKREYPFGDERREVEFIFQSALTDQAVVQYTNSYLDPHYWLDNVSVKEVQVQPVDPNDKQILIYNDQESSQTFPLEGCWSDVDGNYHNGAVTLPSFRSIVLVKEADEACDNIPAGMGDALDSAPGTAYPNPIRPGAWLHLPANSGGTFFVWAMNGRLICRSQVDPSSNMVLLPAGIAPGAYVAAITIAGNAQRFKLMVQ
ncbi:MAG: right-handed parallel beta-helix repeat-containing protein, partial [Flavobacteriales bacterium]